MDEHTKHSLLYQHEQIYQNESSNRKKYKKEIYMREMRIKSGILEYLFTRMNILIIRIAVE